MTDEGIIEYYEERAAILEFEANMARKEAEDLALEMALAYAQGKVYCVESDT